ncbi:DUF6890 family protein [Maridesulfovibrio zosterae]
MQLQVLCCRWFPGQEVTEESMAEALWLEQDFWEKMSVAVSNGISKAFRG